MTLLTETTINLAQNFAERVRAQTRQLTLEYHGSLLPRVTLPLGAASFPDNGGTPADILAAADQALYKAKRTGRNRVCSA